MQENNTFEFTYTAPTEAEKKQIESIRSRYSEHVEGYNEKLARIKQLDRHVQGVATATSLTVGILGCLTFGLGMAMVLEWSLIIPGVAVAIAGTAPMLFAYPAYKLLISRGKKKYGEEIIRLSGELLGE